MSAPAQKYEYESPGEAGKKLAIRYEEDLNAEQLRAVREGDGRSLVLAGAGSGKTRTLTYRVAWLLEHGIPADRIILLTFTNKAAREMLNRVALLVRGEVRGLWGGTYHHIAHVLLRARAESLGYGKNYQIIDQDDAERLMRSILRDIPQASPAKTAPKADAICRVISFSVNSGQPLSRVLESTFPGLKRHTGLFEEAARGYHERKRAMNAMDFDDLLSNFLRLLTQDEETRRAIASRFRYVLVDEYQDTNRIQAALTRHLSSVHGNLMVVGDDAQSIYSFRAADVGNILDFTDEYPGAKVFRLETNYRSQPQILKLANASIRNNVAQYEKELKGVKQEQEKPVLVSAPDPETQASFIADEVVARTREGSMLADIAVLFRASHQTLELELELAKRDIPYVKRGGLRYFEQAHIKDVLSYLRVLANPLDELAWRRLLTLYGGIGTQTADAVWGHIRSNPPEFLQVLARLGDAEQGMARGRAGIQEVGGDFAALAVVSRDDPEALIETILERRYREYAKNSFDDAEDRIIDLETLAEFAGRYAALEPLLADAALGEGFKGEIGAPDREQGADRLVLSTIHQAKGLEWKTVFVIGLVDGHFPNARTLERERELEEERRLFYVAVTRAKEDLFLTYPETSYISHGFLLGRPSVFVRELPKSVYRRIRMGGGMAEERFEEEVIEVESSGRESILDKIMGR